jgi:hypothetical protein
MTKTMAVMAAFAALVVAGSVAAAGTRYDQPVDIIEYTDGSGFAEGALGTVRNAPGDYAEIGCFFAKYVEAETTRATCYAFDEDGNAAICSTTNPSLLETIAFTSDTAYIRYWFDASGRCTDIDVEVGSGFAPKAP